MATNMRQSTSDTATTRAWVATALIAAAVGGALVLFFVLGDDIQPILTTVTTTLNP